MLLTLTIIALFYRLLAGQVLFWGLPSLQFYPWHEFAAHELAQERLPLWNPYNGAGAPLLANYQSALLYPPNWLYFIIPGPQLMGNLGMLHVLWAGIGMWLLLGRLKCDALGRGIGTLAFPLCTTLIARFGTFPMLDVAAWLPWLMLALDMLLDGATLRRLFFLAGVVAMQLLAGHAQWTFYSFVLAGGYALWRIIRERRPFGVAIVGLIAVLFGAGIAAIQLLPTAELQVQSQRASGVDETFALNFSYPPLSLLTLFNPDFFGNPGDGTYVIKGAYFELTAYVGFLPLTLAILGAGHYFRMMRRKRHGLPAPDFPDSFEILTPFFSVVVVVALILALGRFGIYPLLYRYVPTFRLFQAPARWLLLAVFSLSVLAALSTSMWKPDRRARSRAQIALIGAIILVIAGITAQSILRAAEPITLQLVRGLIVTGVLALITALIFMLQPSDERGRLRWMIAVLAFVAVDLWWANARSNPTIPADFYQRRDPVTASRVFWPDVQNQQLPQAAFDLYLPLNDYRVAMQHLSEYRQSQLPDLNVLDRQLSLNSFDPLRPDGFERFMHLLNTTLRSDLQSDLQRAAAVGKVYGPTITLIRSGETAPPRVWMVPQARSFKSADDAERFISSGDWNPAQTVAIEGDVNVTPSRDAGTANIVSETSQDLYINVDSPGGGVLVVADSYYPGWLASFYVAANAVPISAPIYRANLAFRAVVMPPGKHRVHMNYQPVTYYAGALVSGIATLAFATCFILAFRRPMRKRA